jgi:hypothetical protein
MLDRRESIMSPIGRQGSLREYEGYLDFFEYQLSVFGTKIGSFSFLVVPSGLDG